MTHLDNGGEVELGWPGLGRVGVGLECGGAHHPTELAREPAGERNGLQE